MQEYLGPLLWCPALWQWQWILWVLWFVPVQICRVLVKSEDWQQLLKHCLWFVGGCIVLLGECCCHSECAKSAAMLRWVIHIKVAPKWRPRPNATLDHHEIINLQSTSVLKYMHNVIYDNRCNVCLNMPSDDVTEMVCRSKVIGQLADKSLSCPGEVR